MRLPRVVFAVFLAPLLLSACADTYTRVTIPRTPENLEAFRECQRTVAVAVGYDHNGILGLKRQCLSTLEGTRSERVSGHPKAPSGCSQIDQAGKTVYYFCPVGR